MKVKVNISQDTKNAFRDRVQATKQSKISDGFTLGI